MKKPFTLIFALGLVSCAAPKAIVVEEAPKKRVEKVAPVSEPLAPALADDGLRLPEDMLTLPNNSQLRPSAKPSGDGAAPVIVRPPKD